MTISEWMSLELPLMLYTLINERINTEEKVSVSKELQGLKISDPKDSQLNEHEVINFTSFHNLC